MQGYNVAVQHSVSGSFRLRTGVGRWKKQDPFYCTL